MKKIISVLLSVIMIFSLVSAGVSAADVNELKITVANDLHYNQKYSNTSGTDYVGEDYSHVPSNGQLWIESELIIDTFLAEIAQNDSRIVLLPGDLADRGTRDEHRYFAQKLADFEEATGKRVYVAPGNHDYYGGITPAEFATFYAQFGYGEAIAKDTKSASYVVDLDGEYRLLAIDSCVPRGGNAGIDEERKAWIEEQAKKAQKDGKKVISMMHHNLLNHFIFGDILHAGAFVDSKLNLPELYAQYNIKYNFVAHTHAQDIKAYTGSNGVTIYDVLTSSLNLYPIPYRTVVFGDEVEIRTEIIEKVDVTSKQGIISDNCYKLATEDFQQYALNCTKYGLDKVFDQYSSAENIKDLLGLDEEKDPELSALVDSVIGNLRTVLDMPMYVKDETSAGQSIEAYAEKLGLMLPETEFSSIRELAIFTYINYVEGDENCGFLSNEYNLLVASVTTMLNYLVADVSAEDYVTVLTILTEKLNLNISVDYVYYAGELATRAEGIDIFVSAFANTLLLHFTTDEGPADNNVVLPSYDEPAFNEAELTLWEKIVNFIRNALTYFLRIFGMGE